jgi:TnpA family transposase
MAQFYASLATGHVTASTPLKRIVGFTSKNHFYQANVQLGRILKTEHILYWMADPQKRRRTRKGLLKVEQIHQLARNITYGNRGRLKGKHWKKLPVQAIVQPSLSLLWQFSRFRRCCLRFAFPI